MKGPLNVARPIQGYPVIAQAGSSGPGQDLGSRIADLIYTAQKTREAAVAFYGSVKAHGAAAGRDPCSMLVMPGILPIMGRTRQEAQDRFDQLQDLVHPRVGLPFLADTYGDLSDLPPDGPLPPPLRGQQRGQERARGADPPGPAAGHDHEQALQDHGRRARAITWRSARPPTSPT